MFKLFKIRTQQIFNLWVTGFKIQPTKSSIHIIRKSPCILKYPVLLFDLVPKCNNIDYMNAVFVLVPHRTAAILCTLASIPGGQGCSHYGCHSKLHSISSFYLPVHSLRFQLLSIVILKQNTIFWTKYSCSLVYSKNNLSVAFSPQAKYTDRATAACRRS
jgi:hypothetical protein